MFKHFNQIISHFAWLTLVVSTISTNLSRSNRYHSHPCYIIGERERANLIVQRARFFWYIYIYIYLSRAIPYRKPSTRFQINATYDISQKLPRVYRRIHSSRRCTVATVQDEANPSSSQPAASCCVASESTEAHRDGWRQYVLVEESVLPRKQPKRKRGV